MVLARLVFNSSTQPKHTISSRPACAVVQPASEVVKSINKFIALILLLISNTLCWQYGNFEASCGGT
jgi:hypothetical protein